MRRFVYARATTIDDALAAAREPGTAVLAGGTELLNWLRLGIAAPDRVLDITRIAGLDRIEQLAGGGLRIGALVRLNDVAADEVVARDWPVLREAIHKSASAQIRNLATIGANLLEKTRCAYFRSDQPVRCNRRVRVRPSDRGCRVGGNAVVVSATRPARSRQAPPHGDRR